MRPPLRDWDIDKALIIFLAVLSVILACAAIAAAQSPPPLARAARVALVDIQRTPPADREFIRYVVEVGEDREDRDQRIAVDYLLNAVSRTRAMIRCEPLPAGVLRIDLSQMARDEHPHELQAVCAAWEAMADADPYFHMKTEAVVAGKRITSRVDGGWIEPRVAAGLRLNTKSHGPILRADYFVANIARPPAYYNFAGVQATENEFLRDSAAVDRKQQNDLAANSAANLLISKITDRPRRVVMMRGPLGGVYQTLDVEKLDPTRDPIRNPINVHGPEGPQFFRHDASEWFVAKSNKFITTALFNAAGERQNSVPEKIAKDLHARDGILQPIISCIRCHENFGGVAGLQPIEDDQYRLLTGESSILKSFIPSVARRIGELYEPARMKREIDRDREDYAEAVYRATGYSAGVATSAVSRVYQNFSEEPVTLFTAAAEAGVTPAAFVAATTPTDDPIIISLKAGRRVKRESYEASFQEIMLRTWAAPRER